MQQCPQERQKGRVKLLLLSRSGKKARKAGSLFHWERRLAKLGFSVLFKMEPHPSWAQVPWAQFIWKKHSALDFVSSCTGATCHLQQHLQESWFVSCCYLLLTALLFKLPHAIILLFASTLAEYKTKSACENQELKLHCQESKFLIIYSATYGRWAHEESVCSTKAEHTPPFGMSGHH